MKGDPRMPGSDETLLGNHERLDLLVRLLAAGNGAGNAGELRQALLGDMQGLEGTFAAATRRQLVPAAIAALTTRGILPVPPAETGARPGIVSQLAMAQRLHRERRQILRDTLLDSIAVLNQAGIEPLLLKGAVSLVTGEPAWRTLRDIDFAIRPDEARTAQRVLQEAGFQEVADDSARPHHLHPLTRDGFPATLEPHVMLGGARARSVLSDALLWHEARDHSLGDARFKQLAPAAFALHGLGHHYFQNRGYLFGTISLKGLLEFCAAVQALPASDATQFRALSATIPHLAAGVATVSALGVEMLGLKLPEGYVVPEAATRAARDMAARLLGGRTQSPFKAVLTHSRIAGRAGDGALAGSLQSLQRGVRDALHTAVWFDGLEQRRNASGILQDL